MLSTDYSYGVVYVRLGRAGRTSKTLLLFSESGGNIWGEGMWGAGRGGRRDDKLRGEGMEAPASARAPGQSATDRTGAHNGH